jgi:hypothetical protein
MDLWEAIADSEGLELYEIMDGDLTEYLWFNSHERGLINVSPLW